ncbi:MAG: hypothetical protein R8G66_04430 [Cytophagales bacterium]|nr:hypothetical protein [Cytophagales bacterium]
MRDPFGTESIQVIINTTETAISIQRVDIGTIMYQENVTLIDQFLTLDPYGIYISNKRQ